ncbi:MULTISPECIES: NEW3 domain-containing protein [Bacillaceae]|uniref:Alpha-galactosidase NEW3 domain-containing protein n=1 Tax=Evansella alkalicola TaxID=745819 RepID=A0ABS6K0Q4_9BACI|nr:MULTISPECIES: NEW3 domain-containing protein [Bacillaceae]MBU9722940.1 hypothetical protein [Bacillus alkalicola]
MLKKLILVMSFLTTFIVAIGSSALAQTGLTLYTPYTGISVTPGENVNYSFDITNHTDEIQLVSFEVNGLPGDWDYDITASGNELHQLAIRPNEEQSISVDVNVPLEVEEGDYRFTVAASSESGVSENLPITLTISERGTFETELTTEQANMEGDADASFSYSLSLRNRTAEEQNYSLRAQAGPGWNVTFQVGGNNVTSVSVDSNETENINVVVFPPPSVEAGEYIIPVSASTNATSADLELEAVITGKYDIDFSTPSGLLSGNITAGRDKTFEMEVTNTGTRDLTDISFSSNTPMDWDVEFSPGTISTLEPGESQTVRATISASKNAIAGDYVVEMTASTDEAESKKEFRIQVETSMLWGWISILIILGVITGIFFLIRKYGRR